MRACGAARTQEQPAPAARGHTRARVRDTSTSSARARRCYIPDVKGRRLRFRRASHAEIGSIVALVESAYRGAPSRAGWTTEADLLDGQRTDAHEIAALIDEARSSILLALLDRELVGCVRLTREPSALYVGMLAVAPSKQAHGIGGALLQQAERRARALGMERVRMTVIAQRSELIAWYERRGYARTGEREPFPYGDPRFGVPRRPDLCFEVLAKAL